MTNAFDEFSKSLAEESVPRRETLRRLGAIFTGALLGPLALGLDTASPHDGENRDRRRRRRHGKGAPCKPSRSGGSKDPCLTFCRCSNKRKQNQCLAACRSCNSDTSRLHGTCGNYVCCGAGQSYCGGSCTDLNNDANNCGSCGNVCGAGATCVNGTCSGGGAECPSGQTMCGETCVNLSYDNSNCGACGNVCASGSSCVNGTCSGGGGGDCPPDTDFMWDSGNCGACGNVCPDQTACAWGVCEGICYDCGY